MFTRLRLLALALVAGVLFLLAACGGDDDDGAAGTQPATTAEAAANPLDGAEIGYVSPLEQNVTIKAIGDALKAHVGREGATVTSRNASFDFAKQNAQIREMVAKDVAAIFTWGLWETFRPAVIEADRAGIPTVTHDAHLTPSSEADFAPAVFQVIQGRDSQAKSAAKFFNEKLGGKGEIIGMTLCANAPTHVYLFERFKAALKAYPGLKLVTVVCNQTDDAAGARPVAQHALTRYRNVRGVYTYNDPSGIGTARAAESLGIRDRIVITGYNAGPDGVQAVKDGTIDATWDYKPVEIGDTLAKAIALQLAGNTSFEKFVIVEPILYTKDNIDEFVSWEDRIQQIKDGEYIGLDIE